MAAVLTAATYLALEQAMLSKIRSDIKATLGDDYAIIALHMEGNDHDRPSLWRMLRRALIYEANFDGEYTPQGSGGFTGKKHHLALLISDHKKISFCEWSFRNWSLVINEYGTPECAIIENLSETDQKLYRHDVGGLRIQRGLNYRNSLFNHEKIRWYNRPVKEPEVL